MCNRIYLYRTKGWSKEYVLQYIQSGNHTDTHLRKRKGGIPNSYSLLRKIDIDQPSLEKNIPLFPLPYVGIVAVNWLFLD